MDPFLNHTKIFIDGSSNNKVSTWGMFIPGDSSDSILMAGLCPKLLWRSSDAEFFALYKTLSFLKKQKINNEKIIIYSDFKNLTYFNKENIHNHKLETSNIVREEILKLITELRKENNLIKIKHTYGHNTSLNPNSLGNRVIDIVVRKTMRESSRQNFESNKIHFVKENFITLLEKLIFKFGVIPYKKNIKNLDEKEINYWKKVVFSSSKAAMKKKAS